MKGLISCRDRSRQKGTRRAVSPFQKYVLFNFVSRAPGLLPLSKPKSQADSLRDEAALRNDIR